MDPTSLEGLYTGYQQSKWVAEALVKEARSRGLPVTIHRPGRITGHSRTGEWNHNDLGNILVRGFLQLGVVPDLDMMVDMSPVDYVARAIVHLSRRPDSIGRVFHFSNPGAAPAATMVEWLRSLGYPLRQVDFTEWYDRLASLADDLPGSPISVLSSIFSREETPRRVQMPRVSCANTTAALADTEIRCPPVTRDLLHTYVGYLQRAGLVEAPAPRSPRAATPS
jgi:thioester reductase-like protein